MKYIAIIHKEQGTAYGVTLPDFPGCFSAADTLDEVPRNIQEAVELWAEGEEIEPPVPTGFEEVAQSEAAQGGILMLVDINFDFLDQKVVPVNISMPVYMRNRIDRAARARGLTRFRLYREGGGSLCLKSHLPKPVKAPI